MPTVEKEIDGETREIEVTSEDLGDDVMVMDRSTLNDEYVKADYHEREINRVKDRFDESATEEAKQELREDEDFIQEVLDEHGTDDERVQTLKAEKEKLESKLEETESQLSSLSKRVKGQVIREAAGEADIADQFTARPNGKMSYIERTLLDDHDVEEVDGKHVVVDENGDRLSAPSDSDETFMTVSQFLRREDFDDLRGESEPTKGSGFEDGGSGGSLSGTSWDEMSSGEKLQALREVDGDREKAIEKYS